LALRSDEQLASSLEPFAISYDQRHPESLLRNKLSTVEYLSNEKEK
jgi:hypothetical protein